MQKLPRQSYSTWAEIELGAIQSNIRAITDCSRSNVMAVVKANAYGHGAVPVAKAAVEAGATWLGVARLEEALELRHAGLSCPILLLGYIPHERMDEAISKHISMTVWEGEQVEQAAEAGKRVGITALVHLKVDTGMGRLGVKPEQAVALAATITERPASQLALEGVFTHFAMADEPHNGRNHMQETIFLALLESFRMSGIFPPVVHAYNSAAGLTRQNTRYNLVRAGIAIYGLQPSARFSLPQSFKPALSWKTVLSQVKAVPPGQGVSYGHTYIAAKRERIGTVPVGYADGFRRLKGNQVIAGGRLVPVVGRVCMDQVMVQLDHAPKLKTGDEIVLIGSQGECSITAEQVAQRWGTINYEVVCGIGARVPRVYI